MSEVRASEIFDRYPDSDLIELPKANCRTKTISTYLDWIPAASQHFGDTLLQFVLLELNGCDRSTSIERLQVAIDDLQTLKEGLEE